jgi:hypothetical protein
MTTFKYNQSPESRYNNTPATILDGKIQYELWQSYGEIRRSTDYRIHVVRDTDVGRLDLIAYEYYGNPGWWWIIADANNVLDIFSLRVGASLKIPSRTVVERYMSDASSGNR